MNKNIFLHDGFYASVTGENGATWGCDIREERGNVFTKKLALEMLEGLAKLYKQQFPDRPDPKFYKIRYDMTNYQRSIQTDYQGDYYNIPVGPKKVGVYNAKTDTLRIYINGDPIYENKQSVICRDTAAIMDSDGDLVDFA